MRKLITILMITVAVVITSCTGNQRARNFGQEYTVELPENSIIVTATWKNKDLWILVEDTITQDKKFIEYSNWGLIEGEVNFK